MAKHTQRFYVYHTKYSWDDSGKTHGTLLYSDTCTDHEHTLVGPLDVEYEIPDDFDPRPSQLAALQAKKQQIRAEFAKAVKDLDDQIASLLAIEMSPAVEE